MKRRWKNADVYLFFNEGAQMSNHAMTLMSNGRGAETWDAQTGAITPLRNTRTGGHLTVQLHLQPYQTQVVVVR
jgi:hypothetical protein